MDINNKINDLKAKIDAQKDFLDWVYPESKRDEIRKRNLTDIDRCNLNHYIDMINRNEKRLACLLNSI